MSTTLEAPPFDAITDEEADAIVDSPKTLKEWQKLISVYPKNSIKLMCRMHGGGTGWLPGHILVDVYGDTAIIQPPKHGHTEKAKLKDIKVWKKGMANAAHHMQTGPGTGYRTPRGGADALTDPSRTVVYCPLTNGFLGGPLRGRNFRMSLKMAQPYASKDSAFNAVWSYFKEHPKGADTLKPSLEFMTKAVAMARFRDPEPEKAEEKPPEAPAAVVAPPPAAEPAPAPAAVVPPPAAPVAPATVACADCFNAYAKAYTDEAEAEAMMLELRGARIRAEVRVKLDQERRRLGIT